MSDDRAALSSLRLWATLDVVYGAAVAALAAFVVPWKTPAANLALLGYAGLVVLGAPALGFGWRAGYRLAVATSVLALGGTALVVGGLVASFVHLSAIWGSFGQGAALASLFLAGAAFQVLGLYPALRLRALLSRPVRARFGAGRGAASAMLVLAWGVAGAAAFVHGRYAVDVAPPLPEGALGPALGAVRAALEGRPPPAVPDAPLGPGPLYVSIHDGKLLARATGAGATLGEAVTAAARVLGAHPERARLARGRIKIDRPVGRAPLPGGAWLSLSIEPGRDGVRRRGQAEGLLPDDLVAARAIGATAVHRALPEVRVGVSAAYLGERLGGTADLERFRVESWIECPRGACRLERGTVLDAPVDLRAAALAAGDFLLRQQEADHTFTYLFDPLAARRGGSAAYSVGRHAGAIYSLAMLHGATGEARFERGARRALGWLEARTRGCGPGACVVEGARSKLGTTSLALIAAAELHASTGDAAAAHYARRLGDFVRSMQRPDGDFHHTFAVAAGAPEPSAARMYESEEAAFALVKAHRVTRDGAFRDAAARALAHLTGPKYGFFLGRFVHGVDSWTCMAAAEADPGAPALLRFCGEYAAFLRRLQYGAGAPPDFVGHYGFSHLVVPQAPATAGLTEAVLAVVALSRRHGVRDEALEAQARLGLGALARDQVRADNDHLFPEPLAARGAIRRSLVEPEVRIDFVQHAASAFVRGVALGL